MLVMAGLLEGGKCGHVDFEFENVMRIKFERGVVIYYAAFLIAHRQMTEPNDAGMVNAGAYMSKKFVNHVGASLRRTKPDLLPKQKKKRPRKN